MQPPFNFTVTIFPDGHIMMEIDDPTDDRAVEHIMEMAKRMAGDSPIAYSDCLTPEQADAIARRLARMIVGEEAA